MTPAEAAAILSTARGPLVTDASPLPLLCWTGGQRDSWNPVPLAVTTKEIA